MRKLTFIFSVMLHIAFIYGLFNARFQLTIIKTPEKITKVSLISSETKGLAPIKKEAAVEKTLIFTKPSKGKSGPPLLPKGTKKDSKTKTGSLPFPLKANFSFSPRLKQHPLMKHKPDFLLTPDKTKHFHLTAPSGKGKPEDTPDFLKYLDPYSDEYSKVAKTFYGDDTSSPGYGGPGGTYSPQEKGVYARFAARGFNIKPWAKKAVNKIQMNWQIPSYLRLAPKKTMSVGVFVIIEKSGEISTSEIKQKSKEKSLDQSALYALNASSPFPKLPEGFPLKNLEAYFVFNIKNDG